MIRIFAEIAPAGEVTSAYPDYYLFAIIKIKNALYEFSGETLSAFYIPISRKEGFNVN